MTEILINKEKTSLAPIIKWPGGKRRLLKDLLPLIPETSGTYFESFLGGAAVFFATGPASAHLSDTNADLINFYRQVRDKCEHLVDRLSNMENSEESYYRVRESNPTNLIDRAARFLYLCTLSFNGIYRQNLRGKFNVPYGFRTDRDIFDPEKIRLASNQLGRSELITENFASAIGRAKEGDVLYLDPPYTVAHNNNGFIKYNAKIFSWTDQKRLAKLARMLALKGCTVVISNADHSSIVDLYPDFQCLRVQRSSVIAASGTFRQLITECIFHNVDFRP